jgi:ribosome biogenesis GTPase
MRSIDVLSREERRWQRYSAAKEMREVRKQLKRNRKPKRVRQKNWMPDIVDDADAASVDELIDFPQSERIMPRGERERRQARMAEALAALEAKANATRGDAVPAPMPVLHTEEPHKDGKGIIVEVSSGLCRVDLGGCTLVCGVRGSLSAEDTGFTNVVAVGDEVLVSEDGAGRGMVEAVLPRRGVLARPDVFHDGYRTRDRHVQQVIAANVDQLLIVASWRDPHLWPELVDRYLIAAARNNIASVICVNKVDLAEDVEVCRAALRPYLDLAYRVLFTSALTGEGVDELRETLREQITVLAGMSGVGKSSLLAAVEPGLELRTREVSEHSGEGRHATTQVSMLKLSTGGFVVDTPGIREFGLSGLRRGELIQFYPEIAAVTGCRFSDCSHTHEPGCAVKAMVTQGGVSTTRYRNYTKIYRSLPG